MNNWERFYGSDEKQIKSRREKIRFNLYQKLRIPKKMRWYHRTYVMIYPNNDLSRALFISGTYEPNSLFVIKNMLSKGSVCFDIGANAGIFTLALSKWVGEQGLIVAFEPSSREFPLLEETISLNRLSNVCLEKLAISNTTGTDQLNIAIDKHGGQNTLFKRFAYEGVDSGKTETVEVQTIDAYISEKKIPRLDLIKLDIEGAELNAFLGAKQTLSTLRPVLIFEVVRSALQKNGINLGEIESLLITLGYKIFSIDEQTAHLTPKSIIETKDGNVVALPTERLSHYSYLLTKH